MTEPKRTPHRQIQAALRIGYRVAANLSAAGYQLGEPIPEAFARDVELSQLGRLHGVLPMTIERWISLGWDPSSPFGLRDPHDPNKPLTGANPQVAREIQRAATAAAWARQKARRAEERARESAEQAARLVPCRTIEGLREAVLDASETPTHHFELTNAAVSAVRAGGIDHFIETIERRAAEREKRRAVELAELDRRRALEAAKLAASAERIAAAFSALPLPPPVPPPERAKKQVTTARQFQIDRLVLDALQGAIMPLSAISLGRRLRIPPVDVVDAIMRLGKRLERVGTSVNGATYRVRP
jgi:hypothetical protein